MTLYDVYIFEENSSKEFILNFIKIYLSDFNSMDSFYEYPKYKEPTIFETDQFVEMLDFILEDKTREYTFYLENKNNLERQQGIIRINSDGSVCLGLCVLPEYEDKYVKELKAKYKTDYVFVSYNQPPPTSISEVRQLFNPR